MSWDGKTYNKYRIEHTDGTPLKGKKYFVLRLDSDDPVEAARVAAAMRAHEKEPRNCDVGSVAEQKERFKDFCKEGKLSRIDLGAYCAYDCPCRDSYDCKLEWAQMPYREGVPNAE